MNGKPWLALLAAIVFTGAAVAEPLLVGPYQDVSLATQPWQGGAGLGQTSIWAFATGECGHERWGDFDTAAFAAARVAAFVREGMDYIVSTGGEAGGFSCSSDQGMRRFVARYDSPRLVGLDFDIERQQTPAQIDALVRHAQAAQRRKPALRLSFTLATHASADGSRRSLNATGEAVLASLRRHALDTAVLNLMVMNYGPADARWCVLSDAAQPARCDMGRSALQAARNVHEKYGIPYARIAFTAMPGENDVAGNVFTLEDAALMARGAREQGLAGIHHWSLDRDRPCAAGSPRVSPRCHGLPGLAPGQFGEVLAALPAAPKGGHVFEEREPLTPYVQDIVARVNALRAAGARCGAQSFAPAPPVAWSAALEHAAATQVRDMAQRNTVSHAGSDGSDVAARVGREGYNWSAVGENAAAGNATVAATLAQWMNSPGHCSNLMGANFREFAMAGVRLPGQGFEWYWIMVLATPMGGR